MNFATHQPLTASATIKQEAEGVAMLARFGAVSWITFDMDSLLGEKQQTQY